MEVLMLSLCVFGLFACWKWLYWKEESGRFEDLSKERDDIHHYRSEFVKFKTKYTDLLADYVPLKREHRELRDELTYLKTKTKPVIGEDEVDFSVGGWVSTDAKVNVEDEIKVKVGRGANVSLTKEEAKFRANRDYMMAFGKHGVPVTKFGPSAAKSKVPKYKPVVDIQKGFEYTDEYYTYYVKKFDHKYQTAYLETNDKSHCIHLPYADLLAYAHKNKADSSSS